MVLLKAHAWKAASDCTTRPPSATAPGGSDDSLQFLFTASRQFLISVQEIRWPSSELLLKLACPTWPLAMFLQRLQGPQASDPCPPGSLKRAATAGAQGGDDASARRLSAGASSVSLGEPQAQAPNIRVEIAVPSIARPPRYRPPDITSPFRIKGDEGLRAARPTSLLSGVSCRMARPGRGGR